MKIYITGSPSSITRAEAREVIKWMASEMKIDHYRDPIWINLKFRKNLKKRNGYRGSAVWDDRNHRPKSFTIEVDDNLTKRVSIATMIHEMVHVKQYAKGELKDYMRSYCIKRWGSREVNVLKIRYREYPWEKEAYAFEEKYYKRWIEYNKKKHR